MKSGSTGKCFFCHGVFAKSAMTNHLKACKERKALLAAPPQEGKRLARKATIYHIVVEGRELPKYWMHLEAPEDSRLEDLDQFLRDTWLECCWHLSGFTIDETTYESSPEPGIGQKGMKRKLGDVLEAGMKFYHEYDFGTTTELTLRVLSERVGVAKGRSIQVLARNEPPAIVCVSCGKAATQVCSECVWDGEGWLCDKCASEHECGEEMLLPAANSPRVGMCGYTGGG